jgi:hypothetical protein
MSARRLTTRACVHCGAPIEARRTSDRAPISAPSNLHDLDALPAWSNHVTLESRPGAST